MLPKAFVFSFIQTLITVSVVSQSVASIPSLSGFGGSEITLSRTFSESSLYGYINGGAELYLEYGFDTLVVTELTSGDSDIRVEIYRMKDKEAAFGIFSVSRFRCNGGPKLTDHMCRSAYQLQFCMGPFYVSIVNDTGSEADLRVSNEVTRYLLGQIVDPPFNPAEFFATGVNDEAMKSAVLVRGPLGLYNGIPTLSDIMGEATGYSALIVREESKTIASMRFVSDTLATRFTELFRQRIPADSLINGNDPAVSVVSSQHIVLTLE
ncbi:MAG: hypothetical protein MUC78_14180 [Bacteroidales bacterium]|jgi:hypothetical protein|nr:hypothetical protein [Bacteroidales bacterium]